MSTRYVTMTVCSIVANQHDATPFGLTPGSVLINGVVTITIKNLLGDDIARLGDPRQADLFPHRPRPRSGGL